MVETKPKGGFGSIDLEIGDPTDAPPDSAFGEVEVEVPVGAPEPAPASTTRPSIHDDATRMVSGDALAVLARAQPSAPDPEAALPPPPPAHSGNTTRFASLDDDLLAVARASDAPPSVPSNSVPSQSGVSAHDSVARMRELYARGEAEAALAVAESIAQSVPPIAPSGDYPDASIAVDFGPEIEIDVSLSGLEPHAAPPSRPLHSPIAVPPRSHPPGALSAPPAAGLTLTQRQSVPRVVKTPAEIAALPIDPRGGFLLGLVDGMQTLEEILDVCSMPGPEALDLVVTLVNLGVIEFD